MVQETYCVIKGKKEEVLKNGRYFGVAVTFGGGGGGGGRCFRELLESPKIDVTYGEPLLSDLYGISEDFRRRPKNSEAS